MRFVDQCRSIYEWYRALRTLRRIMATLAMLGGVLLSAGCAGPGRATEASAQARLMIANQADHGAWYVRTRRCGEDRWSADLAQNQVIPVGTTRTFGVAPGCVAVRVETTSALAGTMEWEERTIEPGQTDTLRLESWTFN